LRARGAGRNAHPRTRARAHGAGRGGRGLFFPALPPPQGWFIPRPGRTTKHSALSRTKTNASPAYTPRV
jgi:hypothetical protein